MQYRSAAVALATVLGLTSSTSAFLITSDIADAVTQAKESVSEWAWGDSHAVDLACHDCPFFFDEERNGHGNAYARVAVKNVANTIHLDIVANEFGLQVNNATVYPFEAIESAVYAYQNRLEDYAQGIEVPLDFAAAVKPTVHDDDQTLALMQGEEALELIPIDFAVVAVGGVAVAAQSIHVDLIHVLKDDVYRVARVTPGNYEPQLRVDPCVGSATYNACRLRHTLDEQVKDMLASAKGRAHDMKEWLKTDPLRSLGRPCPGKHGKHGGMKSTEDGPLHHIKGGPEHHGHHGHRGFHTRPLSAAERFLRMAHNTIQFVLIPYLMGIAAGLAAGAIGMLVGRTIVYCWARFRRGGRRGPVDNSRVSELEVNSDEKVGLLVVEQDLPRYQDVQADVEAKADL